MKLHAVDISLIAGYLIAVFLLGLTKSKKSKTVDYVLMGRRLSLPAFVMTLVSSWYGGILGVSEYSTSYGVSNWVIFGLPYYVFGITFALLIAKQARQLDVSTLPEIIRNNYGVNAGRLASIWVLLLASPAPYLLTLGFLLNYFFGLPLNLAIVLAAIFSFLYILRGGLTSVVNTDILQFLFMFIGFMALLLTLAFGQMDPLELWASLPDSHKSITGGHSFGYILVWFFIASWTLVDPGFHQRVYATTSPEVARKGILVSVVCWFIFDIMTTMTGLYAYSLLAGSTVPAQAFLELGHLFLPIGLQGLFFAAILATVMSTLDSNILVSGIVMGQDLLADTKVSHRYKNDTIIKSSMLLILILGIFLAVRIPSVVNLWYTFGTFALPALLLPTLFSIFNKPLPKTAVLLNFTLPPVASLAWFNFGKIDEWNYLFGVEPFYPGLLMSLLFVTYFKYINKDPS